MSSPRSEPADWHPLALEDESPFAPSSCPVAPRPVGQSGLGIAVDLGTTQLRIALWDLRARRRLGALVGTNPQVVFGANILSRLAEARDSPENARNLAQRVQVALGEGLMLISQQCNAKLRRIRKLAVVGNTAMLSLFSGESGEMLLQPEHWKREIVCRLVDSGELARRWGLADNAQIALIQPLGGFVGSDLLANVLAVKLLQAPAGSLLVDFGTNTEIALWDGKVLWVTSTPGGCAFAGPGILPARAGAVFRIAAEPGAAPRLQVIGGGQPRGLCGSGMVDLIALLRERGQLDRVGRFTGPAPQEGLTISPDLPGLNLRKRDIDGFQRGKGAMAAAMHFLLQRAGLKLADIPQLFVSGAFGQCLHIGHAQAIGLLPAIPAQRIRLAGDAALAGCEHVLLNPKPFPALAAIRNRSILINLGDSLEFEDLFIENLYLQPMTGVAN